MCLPGFVGCDAETVLALVVFVGECAFGRVCEQGDGDVCGYG